jgi:hypothetical protein
LHSVTLPFQNQLKDGVKSNWGTRIRTLTK